MKNKEGLSFGKKISLISIGIVLGLILLETGLRAGGFVLLFLQEERNRISLKQRDAYRIVCLGESTTFNAWPRPLESILNRQSKGMKFSIIDKGVSGTSLTNILMELEDNIKKYAPDMIIAMTGINDELYGDIIFYTDRDFFLKNLKTYKLIRILWLNILAKTKENGIHKSDLKKQTAQLYRPASFGLSDNELKISGSDKTERISGDQSNKEGHGSGYDAEKACIELAESHMNRGEHAEAEKLFNKAIEINPKSDRAYLRLGVCYETLYPDKVIATYSKAIEINPNNGIAYFQLGLFNERSRNCDKAIEMYKNAIKVRPLDESSYFGLLSCYRKLKRYDIAEEYLKELLKVDPQNARAYGALAMLYEEQGKYRSARTCSRKANSLRLKMENITARHKFQEFKDIITQRGIKLVIVQYPLRSIEPLKNMFARKENVVFVDNEKIFKDALKTARYEDYFIDSFAGEFGHCTEKGNELLAENIAKAVLKDLLINR